jgi:hypothetical protein
MIAFKDVIKSFAETAAGVLNKGRDKHTLENLLKDPRWPSGRSIKALAQAIGRDEETTRRLLNELGARRITLAGDIEGWTLREAP